MPNLPIEKILQELRLEHSNLCAAIAALEALAASSQQPPRRMRRRLQPIDPSWIDAAQTASRRIDPSAKAAAAGGEQ